MSAGYGAGAGGEQKISSDSILTEIRLLTSKLAQSFVSNVSAKFVSTHLHYPISHLLVINVRGLKKFIYNTRKSNYVNMYISQEYLAK